MRIVALLLCVGLCACTGVVSGGDAAGSNTDAGEACAPANRNDEIRLALAPDSPKSALEPRFATVSATQFGDAWPLTVPDGQVSCWVNATYFHDANRVAYPLNGVAGNCANAKHREPGSAQCPPVAMQPLEQIWRKHPIVKGARVDVAYTDQFGPVVMPAQRFEVIGGDAAAADQREADLAVGDGSGVLAHGRLLRL